jgi:hypothetical protein
MVVALGAVGGSSANAIGVESSGVFELEATQPLTFVKGKLDEAHSGTDSDPNAVDDSGSGDDWENVYAKHLNAASADGDAADVSKFITDTTGAGDDIFTMGGSKDPNNITSWRHTTGTVQDKNDIEHAYAARYNADPSLTPDPRPAYVYFGLDRYATAGDATLGFWFLKGRIAKQSNGTFGTAAHQTNDLLIQIDYVSGGSEPIVAISHWDAALNNGAGGLVNDITSNAALCGASTNQPFCAATNLQEETAPWPFRLKTLNQGGTDTDFAPRTFFEGGVDLAHFHLDDECFSSFVAETRSSQSFTSTLSDFAGDSFASCSATATTTPSRTTAAPGVEVTDTVRIAGVGAANAPYPNSSTTSPGLDNNVSFYLCGPIASATTYCTDPANGTVVPQDKELTPDLQAPGVSTATSDPVNTVSNPLAPGRYCWLATWAGDENYPDGITGETNASAECFTVTDTTSASSTQSWLPNDSATITAGSSGTTVSGVINITLYPTIDCTGTAVPNMSFSSGTLSRQGSISYTTNNTTTFAVSATGASSYSWLVTFTSDNANVGGSTHCESTALTINNNQTPGT